MLLVLLLRDFRSVRGYGGQYCCRGKGLDCLGMTRLLLPRHLAEKFRTWRYERRITTWRLTPALPSWAGCTMCGGVEAFFSSNDAVLKRKQRLIVLVIVEGESGAAETSLWALKGSSIHFMMFFYLFMKGSIDRVIECVQMCKVLEEISKPSIWSPFSRVPCEKVQWSP